MLQLGTFGFCSASCFWLGFWSFFRVCVCSKVECLWAYVCVCLYALFHIQFILWFRFICSHFVFVWLDCVCFCSRLLFPLSCSVSVFLLRSPRFQINYSIKSNTHAHILTHAPRQTQRKCIQTQRTDNSYFVCITYKIRLNGNIRSKRVKWTL